MVGETKTFFDQLAQREHEPLLAHAKGTLQLRLVHAGKVEDVYLVVGHGRAVVRDEREASPDCVVELDRSLFDRFTTGRENAMAAFLRGEVQIDGDPALLMRLGRMFPGPPLDESGSRTEPAADERSHDARGAR